MMCVLCTSVRVCGVGTGGGRKEVKMTGLLKGKTVRTCKVFSEHCMIS